MIVALAKNPVDSQDVFLFHKTTHRFVYDQAKADFPDCDDVILWNESRRSDGKLQSQRGDSKGRKADYPAGRMWLAGRGLP